ncbi:hypothetical protein M758_2G049300 [Ceratodon purpureus]|nr:hypothetical protein M758_2G049300 [Ceratodon purpureus]
MRQKLLHITSTTVDQLNKVVNFLRRFSELPIRSIFTEPQLPTPTSPTTPAYERTSIPTPTTSSSKSHTKILKKNSPPTKPSLGYSRIQRRLPALACITST